MVSDCWTCRTVLPAGSAVASVPPQEHTAPFPVPGPGEINPGLQAQLCRYRVVLGTDAPDGAVLVFLRCWVLLYGAVAMEVFGHLGFAFDDPAPMFEFTLADLARLVGLNYPVTGG